MTVTVTFTAGPLFRVDCPCGWSTGCQSAAVAEATRQLHTREHRP